MKIKLFGKEIFDFKKSSSDMLVYNSQDSLKNSKFLPDFYSMRANSMRANNNDSSWSVGINEGISNLALSTNPAIKKEEKELEKKFKLTPKKVFELKFLNKKDFKINTDKDYIDTQIQIFKEKLNLIQISEFDMSRGTNEIASILIRLENRKQYIANTNFFEEYAYTTTERITNVVKKHSHLQLGKVEQFIADMPREAITAMKDYTSNTERICKKKPVFYIIADKKDFKVTDQRRDPILLVQSPFGHFWQILGAWDDEMMFLEEL